MIEVKDIVTALVDEAINQGTEGLKAISIIGSLSAICGLTTELKRGGLPLESIIDAVTASYNAPDSPDAAVALIQQTVNETPNEENGND